MILNTDSINNIYYVKLTHVFQLTFFYLKTKQLYGLKSSLKPYNSQLHYVSQRKLFHHSTTAKNYMHGELIYF